MDEESVVFSHHIFGHVGTENRNARNKLSFLAKLIDTKCFWKRTHYIFVWTFDIQSGESSTQTQQKNARKLVTKEQVTAIKLFRSSHLIPLFNQKDHSKLLIGRIKLLRSLTYIKDGQYRFLQTEIHICKFYFKILV